MTLGERIRKLRKEKMLTLAQLAKMANLGNTGVLNRIELNITKNPQINTLLKIADALGESLDFLCKGIQISDGEINKRVCGTCVFHIAGVCYRYPPQAFHSKVSSSWGRPEVNENSFCGEWKPKG